jgi:hypothetical protein
MKLEYQTRVCASRIDDVVQLMTNAQSMRDKAAAECGEDRLPISMVRNTVFGEINANEPGYPVTFDKSSQGQVAMIIYEWTDEDFLGKERQNTETFEDLPVGGTRIQDILELMS